MYPVECDDNGESDCPQHCGSGAECLEPTIIDNFVNDPIGKFLENDLTADGVAYVVDAFLESSMRPCKVADRSKPCISAFWMQWYLDNGYEMESALEGFTIKVLK